MAASPFVVVGTVAVLWTKPFLMLLAAQFGLLGVFWDRKIPATAVGRREHGAARFASIGEPGGESQGNLWSAQSPYGYVAYSIPSRKVREILLLSLAIDSVTIKQRKL